MNKNLDIQELKGKYSRLREEIFDLAAAQDVDTLKNIKNAVANAEQDCFISGIKKETPEFFYQKAAALLYAFKHSFSVKDEQRSRYVQWALVISGYEGDEREAIKDVIKGKDSIAEIIRRKEEKKEGKLEKKVI